MAVRVPPGKAGPASADLDLLAAEWDRGWMGRRKRRRPHQCQHVPCRRRATFRLVWYAGQVTFQCERHASAAQRVAVRAGLPLLLTSLEQPV